MYLSKSRTYNLSQDISCLDRVLFVFKMNQLFCNILLWRHLKNLDFKESTQKGTIDILAMSTGP